MTTYPTVTIWQPWVALIMADAKPFEFRRWAAPRNHWGKRVAIHAGAHKIDRVEMQGLLLRLRSPEAALTGLKPEIAIPLIEAAITSPGSFPRAAVMCLATLGQPIRGAVLAEKLGLPAINDSDRDAHSNWGWPLTEIEPLTPYIPARGSQGWWRWTMPSDGGAT